MAGARTEAPVHSEGKDITATVDGLALAGLFGFVQFWCEVIVPTHSVLVHSSSVPGLARTPR